MAGGAGGGSSLPEETRDRIPCAARIRCTSIPTRRPSASGERLTLTPDGMAPSPLAISTDDTPGTPSSSIWRVSAPTAVRPLSVPAHISLLPPIVVILTTPCHLRPCVEMLYAC